MSDRPHDHPRKEERREVVSFVWYKLLPVDPATGERSFEGVARSCDISPSGVGMVIARPLDPGAWVFLELGLRVGRVSVVGRVRHCHPMDGGLFRVGCALDVMPPNDRQAVAKLLGA